MSTHPTTTDRAWRVMRFETASGKYAEVASNEVGPEAIPVPAGYKFVRSTPMVPCDDAALERSIAALGRDYPSLFRGASGRARRIAETVLAAAGASDG